MHVCGLSEAGSRPHTNKVRKHWLRGAVMRGWGGWIDQGKGKVRKGRPLGRLAGKQRGTSLDNIDWIQTPIPSPVDLRSALVIFADTDPSGPIGEVAMQHKVRGIKKGT